MADDGRTEKRIYRCDTAPTLAEFHRSGAQIRCIVGPVGSGKTSAATWEVFYYLPRFLRKTHDIKSTRWVLVRNTFKEIEDTTWATIQQWFGDIGSYNGRRAVFELEWPDGNHVEILFRGCDILKHVRQFKSLELTGYWADESIEVKQEVLSMLKNRAGRWKPSIPVRFGIETTNPPSTTHPTYSTFKWNRPPPGPMPKGQPLKNHAGFWQVPGENEKYLRPGYYADLRNDYVNDPDWVAMYIDGKPGIVRKGKLVYNNFAMDIHVAKQSLRPVEGATIYRGWDNTGNHPACVLLQIPSPFRAQVLPSYWDGRMGITDFTKYIQAQCAALYPTCKFVDWGDPAGEANFSHPVGGLTSNAKIMRELGIQVQPSEQAFRARVEAVDQMLARRDGLLIDPDNALLIDGFMGGYHFPEIGTTGYHADAPEKNKYADAHDALQYVMVKLFGRPQLDEDKPLPPMPEIPMAGYYGGQA